MTVVFALLLLTALGTLLLHITKVGKLRVMMEDQKLAHDRDRESWQQQIVSLNTQHDEEREKWRSLASALKSKIDALARYQTILDAEAKASEILESAQRESVSLTAEAMRSRQEAQKVLEQARNEASSILAQAKSAAEQFEATAKEQAAIWTREAREKGKELLDRAQGTLDSAMLRAGTVLDQAEKRAKEIAGEAYEALQNAAQLEKTAKAMQNIIDGYGDKYIIPGHSLLDDLAEEFGHKEAGEKLKQARENTKTLIRVGRAAVCDYVEQYRRETAVQFVTDAFNGKVDSILSRVRSDNAGILEQEIRDAFALVNNNGSAFRNARISPNYLDSRLEELKWAAVAQQLKIEEREEQRRIQEQMREEEKARREYEKALREAARDEETLRKAMARAQEQIDKATSEQRAKYEGQLAELQMKLKEAEEKSQRAKSMAEQTKRGHVYVISNLGSFGENVFKIGLTRRLEPLDRVHELGDSSVPFEFDVHAMIPSDDAPALESLLHRRFVMQQVNKVNHRKEFFRVSLTDIHAETQKMGLEVKWTMAAEAREYRESLALEKTLAASPALRDDWIRREAAKEVAEVEKPDAEPASPATEGHEQHRPPL